MPIRQLMRYDREGNLKAVLPDNIKIVVLQIAHERILAQSKDTTTFPSADDVINEASLLLKFFE